MGAFIAKAKTVQGVGSIAVYSCKTNALQNSMSDVSTLSGVGGMTYDEAARKLANYCGAIPTLFAGNNLTKVK
jgi:hypothetical protein